MLAIVVGFAPPFAESHAQTVPLQLEAAPTEAPAPPPEVVIWYRASEDCPSGAEFVSSVRVQGRTTRLARVGDHVDYVITLESDGKQSGGRLERQTERGTIAISELRGGACTEVAEALALSLTLAVTPSDPGAPEAPPSTPPPQASSSADPTEAPARARDSTVSESPVSASTNAASAERGARRSPAPDAARRPVTPQWWLGGGVEGALGITPDASFGGSLFVAYDWDLVLPARPASLRLGPGFMVSRTSIDGLGHVDQWVSTLGLEFCPLTLFAKSWGIAPCVVGEGGLFVASTDRDTALTSVNFWGSAGPAVRGRALVSPGLELGLTVSVAVPFSRLELMAGQEVLYRTPPAVFSLGVDLSWTIP